MSDQGVILSSSKSGQLVSPGQLVLVDYIRLPTSEGHNSLVRTSIWVFLDSMEIPLSQESIDMPEENIRCQTEVLDLARPSQVSSSSLGFAYVRPPTSEGPNFSVRTPIQVILDSMESPLSQESINRQIDKIGTYISSRKHEKL